MWADGVVVTAPAFDDDLSFPQGVKDLAVEQFVTQATSLTPIWRIASAMPWPCETRTSTCRSFVTISSGLCLFLGISVLLDAKRHTSGRTNSTRADRTHLLDWLCRAIMPIASNDKGIIVIILKLVLSARCHVRSFVGERVY